MRDSKPNTVRRARDLRKRMTDAEVILWSRLRRDVVGGFRFRRQHPLGPYIADFACVPAKLVVEVDGDSHGSDTGIEYDRRRNAYVEALGWRVLRVWNEDVYKRLDTVIEGIALCLIK